MDFSEEDMARIMQWMRENRWSVSDTPGMGNVPAWSIVSSHMLAPSGYGYAIDKEYLKRQEDLNRHLSYLRDMDARREAEGRLLDQQLNGVQQMWRERVPPIRPIGMLSKDYSQMSDADLQADHDERVRQAEREGRGRFYTPWEMRQMQRGEQQQRRGMLDGTMHPRRTPRTRHSGGGVRG